MLRRVDLGEGEMKLAVAEYPATRSRSTAQPHRSLSRHDPALAIAPASCPANSPPLRIPLPKGIQN